MGKTGPPPRKNACDSAKSACEGQGDASADAVKGKSDGAQESADVNSGLDNAGKTTIVKRLMNEDVHSVSPTLGFIIKTIDYKGWVNGIRHELGLGVGEGLTVESDILGTYATATSSIFVRQPTGTLFPFFFFLFSCQHSLCCGAVGDGGLTPADVTQGMLVGRRHYGPIGGTTLKRPMPSSGLSTPPIVCAWPIAKPSWQPCYSKR